MSNSAFAAWRETCNASGSTKVCMSVNDSTNQTRVRLYNNSGSTLSRKFVVHSCPPGKSCKQVYSLTLKVEAHANDASGAFSGTAKNIYNADVYTTGGTWVGYTNSIILN